VGEGGLSNRSLVSAPSDESDTGHLLNPSWPMTLVSATHSHTSDALGGEAQLR